MGNSPSIAHQPFPVFDASYLVESEKEYPVSFNGKMRFKITLSADASKDEIEKAVKSVKSRLSQGETVMGELDHPEELQINLDRVSHIIQDMSCDEANGFGKLKIIDTPMGNIARALLKAGAKLGVSSRGSGNVNESGRVSDFDIVTVDIVAQPSAPDAYPKTIYESLYNMRGGEQIFSTASALTHDKSAERHLMKQITGFIDELKLN